MSTTTPTRELDGASAVGVRLQEFFDDRIRKAAAHGPEYQRLWQAARDASVGGKKLRPALVITVYRALGGTDTDAALAAASAFELLHTALLMHDDVIDRDLVRRGSPNVAGVFTADALEHGVDGAAASVWGEASAILAGDLLIHAAQRLIAALDTDNDRRMAVLDVFDEAVFTVTAGQHADVSFASRIVRPGTADILTMIENKTASYSFIAPLVGGAVLAGATDADVRSLREFGRHVGVAFQLRDDVLGVFGVEELTGKSTLSDLREGKQTLLVGYASTTEAWQRVAPLFGRPDMSEADAADLRAALEASGARQFVESLIADQAACATQLLAESALPAHLRADLADVVRRCVEREW
ncbi:polyprenyl synthetase family protein [Salinibacterium sp. ZJ454]|uniref:polyprenyl synthetase family protein n=1 Tax=Salinibacterium sp. ZJ454 TaxID=2708339 RepID=UPI001421C14A|nr:polyprenyl synthetase family protein [Salinibacterium sp. ZJ454]